MSLEIEIVNQPILLPSVSLPDSQSKKVRAKRRTFKTEDERKEAYAEYRKNYYNEKIRYREGNKSLLCYYKNRYHIPISFINKLEAESRETLNSYCNAKAALDVLIKDHKHLFTHLFDSYVDNKVSISPISSSVEQHKD